MIKTFFNDVKKSVVAKYSKGESVPYDGSGYLTVYKNHMLMATDILKKKPNGIIVGGAIGSNSNFTHISLIRLLIPIILLNLGL